MQEPTKIPQAEISMDIVYRFQVEDAESGLRYFVVVGEDGMAYREVVEEVLRKAG